MTTYCRWGARGTGGEEHPDGERASPEFTGKAVVIGLAIGCLLCFTNLYFGLQTGWISMWVAYFLTRGMRTDTSPLHSGCPSSPRS